MKFIVRIKPYEGGWSTWIHLDGEPSGYNYALDTTHCITQWGARRWGRRRARELKKTSWEIEV